MPTSLILPRRSFLIGAASLLASPAIVKAESLMPVKARLGLPPQLFTSPQLIADAFASKLYERGVRPALLPVGTGRKQLHVHFPGFGSVSSDLIAAAACVLAGVTRKTGVPPFMPYAVHNAAIGSCNGVQVRYVSDYCIGSDSLIHRFDLISD